MRLCILSRLERHNTSLIRKTKSRQFEAAGFCFIGGKGLRFLLEDSGLDLLWNLLEV
jgi:hypothetical protein